MGNKKRVLLSFWGRRPREMDVREGRLARRGKVDARPPRTSPNNHRLLLLPLPPSRHASFISLPFLSLFTTSSRFPSPAGSGNSTRHPTPPPTHTPAPPTHTGRSYILPLSSTLISNPNGLCLPGCIQPPHSPIQHPLRRRIHRTNIPIPAPQWLRCERRIPRQQR